MRICVESVVETDEAIAVDPEAPPTPIDQMPPGVLEFLLQSRYCPSDKVGARALEIVGSAAPGYAQVEAIRAWIHANIEYRYGSSDASTDALDTLEPTAPASAAISRMWASRCAAAC